MFEGKLIKCPLEIMCHICSLLIYWTGLYGEHEQEPLKEGVQTMLSTAKRIMVKQAARQVNQLLLQDDEAEGGEQDQN